MCCCNEEGGIFVKRMYVRYGWGAVVFALAFLEVVARFGAELAVFLLALGACFAWYVARKGLGGQLKATR